MTSLDRDMPADIMTDILHWDYHALPRDSFEVIWASPPCTVHSVAKTVGAQELEEANAIVRRTLDVIEYFNPTYWMMENPQTGLLESHSVVADLLYNDLGYCKDGMPYKKRTKTVEQH